MFKSLGGNQLKLVVVDEISMLSTDLGWILEGVNNVFSHVSLILVATFSVFAKSLLTSFLALVLRTCAPMFLVQNAWVSHFFSQKFLS